MKTAATPSFREAFALWARVGVLSFGGPAGQIALMHRMVVEERNWLTENQFLNALNFSMLLPGPEAMQLATYAGWRLHGLKGGLAAGLLFVLPGAAVVLALAMIYAAFGTVPVVEALFFGVKAAVLVIVIEALLRIAKRALKRREHWLLAAASFIAIFFLDLPYPLIVLGAALIGFALSSGDTQAPTANPAREGKDTATLPQTAMTIAIWLAIWLVPLAMLFLMLGPSHVLPQAGLFFSKLAIVTFGGAYAVLAYMAQQAVEGFGWLSAGEMLDGLGLAETTPGPLILVTEFVGFLAAFREGGEPALLMGLAGAIVTLWVTFAPCFLWIFAGAPYIERIGANAKLSGALTGVTAAVVGVILNLALWFALHVLFAEVEAVNHGPVRLWTPELATFDWQAALLSALAAILLLWRHGGILTTLGVCAGLGLVARFAL
ncbi:MAG: chromate efflux transporter [Hyphomicrobiales bacterium]|nr:chromate efflux transporter [Hyphomicrobiales bacterium]